MGILLIEIHQSTGDQVVSEADKGYELEMLKMIVEKHLDESISVTEKSLNELEAKRDQIVWELATKIYSQSGYKIELTTVRDIVNSRIESIESQLAEEKIRRAEEVQRVVEEDARQSAKESRRIAEEKIRRAGEVQRVAEEKARYAAKEAQRIAEEQILHAEKEVRLSKNRSIVLAKAQQIVSEQLDVNIDEVNLDSPIPWFGDTSGWCSDMKAGPAIDVLTALEEAFDIEIPDGVGGECLSSSGLLVMEIVDFIARKIEV